MSIHDYFKPLAPKHSKKDAWEAFCSGKNSLPPIRIPRMSQNNCDLKNSVSIISFPVIQVPKTSRRPELLVCETKKSKAFKVTTRLLKKSGIKSSGGMKFSRAKDKESIFSEFDQNKHKEKTFDVKGGRVNFGIFEEMRENYEKEFVEKGRKGNYYKVDLERVRTLDDEKPKSKTDSNSRRRYTSIKACLSLPSINNDEFELKGW